MQIIRKRPGQPAEFGTMSESMEGIQEEVGGYFRPVTLVDGLVLLCNEDAPVLGMDENFPIQLHGMLYGPVVFVREAKGNYTSVSEEDMKKLCDFIGFMEMGFPIDG